jgi:hypothetical protein
MSAKLSRRSLLTTISLPTLALLWIIRSVGLPRFPYLAERNFGLYIHKGTWLSGINPSISK